MQVRTEAMQNKLRSSIVGDTAPSLLALLAVSMTAQFELRDKSVSDLS